MTKMSLRLSLTAAALIPALVFGSIAAWAKEGAKFQDASASIENNGALSVAFTETGLGNGNVDYTLTANRSATYACVNRGGNHPEAANKETISTAVSTSTTLEAKNGRVDGEITSQAPSPGSFSCPGGQRLVLACVTYSNIVLTDETNDVSVNLGTESRVFNAALCSP